MRYGIALLAAVAAFSAATASARPPMPTLRADVGEWSIVPSAGSVRAGQVRIDVRNLGAYAHQIVLVRTDGFARPLPLRGNRAVVHPLGETAVVHAGGRASFVVSLRPGSYLLLDNLPWHYWKGTAVAFSVR